MSAFYSTVNKDTTRKINNIIDNLEYKLVFKNDWKKKNVELKRNFSNYDSDFQNRDNPYSYRRNINCFNTNQFKVIPPNLPINRSSDFEVKKIVKEEFNFLIKSYTKEINNNMNILENKMNNMSEEFKNENIKLRNIPKNNDINKEDLLIEIKDMLAEYVSLNEYNKKVKELEEHNKNELNLRNNSTQSLENKFNDKILKMNQSMQDIKSKYEDFNSKYNNFLNNYNNDMKENDSKLLLNENNLNDIKYKNTLFQKNLEENTKEIINIKNTLNSTKPENQKINEIENKQNFINNKMNEFDNKHQKVNEELNQINNNINNIINSIDNI